MNKYQLITNYLNQVSNRAASTMTELKLLQMHIEDIKDTLDGLNEEFRSSGEDLPVQPISNPIKPQNATDLIRIKEVMRMVGLSRSSIYSYISNGIFPKPINLGIRSVAWQRGTIEKWVLNKLKTR